MFLSGRYSDKIWLHCPFCVENRRERERDTQKQVGVFFILFYPLHQVVFHLPFEQWFWSVSANFSFAASNSFFSILWHLFRLLGFSCEELLFLLLYSHLHCALLNCYLLSLSLSLSHTHTHTHTQLPVNLSQTLFAILFNEKFFFLWKLTLRLCVIGLLKNVFLLLSLSLSLSRPKGRQLIISLNAGSKDLGWRAQSVSWIWTSHCGLFLGSSKL